MKRYIKASNSFSTTDEICDAINKVFDGYIVKDWVAEGKHHLEIGDAWGKKLSLVAGVLNTSSRIPHVLYPSSMADNEKCYFKILDNPINEPMLQEFQRQGFREACNYRNSQWGTYKIIIRSYSDLLGVFDIFEKFTMNLLEGQE